MFRILTFIVLTLLAFTISTHAQLQFGVNAGLSIPDLESDSHGSDRWKGGIGFRAGGFSELPFGKTGLRLGLSYSLNLFNDTFDYNLTLHYLSVPVSFYYKPIEKLKILVGPEVNVLLNQDGPTYFIILGEEDFEAVDYGLHLEAEYLLTEQLGISMRNYFGLQFNGGYRNFSGQNIKLDRLNIFSVSATYYFIKR